MPPVGLSAELAYPGPEKAVAARPSEIECQVIDLFDQFRESLLRYTLGFGLSIHDGEEIVQEVFLALFRHLRAGKSRRNLRGWIFSVAHNLALKRRQEVRRYAGGSSAEADLVSSQADPALNPEELMLSAQRQKGLLAAFRALPEQDRDCLRLRAEGLRYRDIARVLGISLGGVSGSLARSLARLMRQDERCHHGK